MLKPLEPWRKLLLDAADLIEERGHCKSALRNEHGQLCLLGAVLVASRGDLSARVRVPDGAVTAMEYVDRYLDEDAVDWNNAPDRTPEQVISALRNCAMGLEEVGQ